jgi:lipopolysaccharide transport system permease protein
VVTHAASCLISHQVILKRVAFPRMLLPFSVVISTMVDLAVMVLLLVGLFVCYQVRPPVSAWFVLPIFAVHLALLVGLGCLFALAHVYVRDVGQALTFLLQLWFFVSPVFYPSSMVPREFKALALWNPMTGLIEGYRSALFLGRAPPLELITPTVIVAVGSLAAGVLLFRRLEGTLSDIL